MSETKVIDVVNQALINDAELKAMVAKTTLDEPAIYENWSERETVFPYVVLRWEFYEGNHWAKRDTILNVDIFTKGQSDIEAENIKTRVIEILDRQKFQSDESGQIRVYLGSDFPIIEDVPDVVHWNITFQVKFWRKHFIGHLTT